MESTDEKRATGAEMRSSLARVNPLLLPEILDKIFSYLRSEDLVACFDVCQVWRETTPAHNMRARAVRAPVLVQDDMSDTHGIAYMASIRKHPSFKAVHFTFMNANLKFPAVLELLKKNGDEITSLELIYHSGTTASAVTAPTTGAIADLLKYKAPNLTTLIITKLTSQILSQPLFSSNAGREPGTPLELTLKRIEISLNYIEGNENPTYPLNIFDFLMGLFAYCPRLEELAVHGPRIVLVRRAVDESRSVIFALDTTKRLKQIKVLHIDQADLGILRVLRGKLTVGQLRSLTIGSLKEWSRGFVDLFPNRETFQELLAAQSSSLEYLEIPVERLKQLTLPPMPKLVQLKLSKRKLEHGGHDEMGRHDANAMPLVPIGQQFLDYATDFPNLRLLGLKGSLFQYTVDEIYSELVRPSSSVRILQEIPIGVDRPLMARIGQLFPNVNIIRAVIPAEHEDLLVSIWENCLNITELFLTLGSDSDTDSTAEGPNVTLDSLLSGIPEEECRSLRTRLPSAEEQDQEMRALNFNKLRSGPSICDLRKLRRLCLDGPGEKLMGYSNGTRRRDRLSNIFGYSTLACLSVELVFVQIQPGLIEITESCIEHICTAMRLEHIPVTDVTGGGFIRLIKAGLGFEQLGPVLPLDWYGLNERSVCVPDTENASPGSYMEDFYFLNM